MRRTTISHFSFLIHSRLSTAIKDQHALWASPLPIKKPQPKLRFLVQVVR